MTRRQGLCRPLSSLFSRRPRASLTRVNGETAIGLIFPRQSVGNYAGNLRGTLRLAVEELARTNCPRTCSCGDVRTNASSSKDRYEVGKSNYQGDWYRFWGFCAARWIFSCFRSRSRADVDPLRSRSQWPDRRLLQSDQPGLFP